jgi:hypothetical protein
MGAGSARNRPPGSRAVPCVRHGTPAETVSPQRLRWSSLHEGADRAANCKPVPLRSWVVPRRSEPGPPRSKCIPTPKPPISLPALASWVDLAVSRAPSPASCAVVAKPDAGKGKDADGLRRSHPIWATTRPSRPGRSRPGLNRSVLHRSRQRNLRGCARQTLGGSGAGSVGGARGLDRGGEGQHRGNHGEDRGEIGQGCGEIGKDRCGSGLHQRSVRSIHSGRCHDAGDPALESRNERVKRTSAGEVRVNPGV